MRFATTLLLLALTASGAGYLYWQSQRGHDAPATDATSFDLGQITPTSLTRIELNDVVLSKTGNNLWTLPGEWPTRSSEVEEYVGLLGSLQSRFVPLPFTKADDFGFDSERKPVVVKTTVRRGDQGEKTYTLTFGEPAAFGNPFIRPTYVRIDDRAEVLRLEPGLIAKLRKNREDFLRKQLFPNAVRTKVNEGLRTLSGDAELPPAAVALLDAVELSVTGPEVAWTLKMAAPSDLRPRSSAPVNMTIEKLASSWDLVAPMQDRVDPDRLRTVLAAVPELWVEAFLPETDLAKTGLDNPERTVSVKFPNHELKLLIGKVSRIKETKPVPAPPANPFSPPQPPPQAVKEEFRYAKLPNNPQVFEIRTDKFAELFVKAAELRDMKLARFKSADVRKLDLVAPHNKLTFVKDKEGSEEKWRLLVPAPALAEGAKVDELIDKLANLQASGPDVIDSADAVFYGLADQDEKTTITLNITEEEPGKTPDAAKSSNTRTVVYRLGKNDPTKSKLYVQTVGRSRINAVPDDLLKLVERPVLAYRSRRVIDLPIKQVTRLSVERQTDPYVLTQAEGLWSLAAPIAIKADSGKANTLANDLAKLDAVEYVNFAPTPDDLRKYGLDSPRLKVEVTTQDGAKTLLLGQQREGKPEVYAKLANAPEVFSVRESIRTALDQSSLAYRQLQLWQANGPTVKKIEVQHGTEDYCLNRDGISWKVIRPFEATAFSPIVQSLLDAASAPRAERFESHGTDDVAKYGLDKPALTLAATLAGERPEDVGGVKKLLIGKPIADGQPARFARLEDVPGVFVIGAAITEAIDKPALELLDRRLLSLDSRQIDHIEGTGPDGTWSAKKNDGKWVIDSLNPPASGDRTVVDGMLSQLNDLRAQRFAAYGQHDVSSFGLNHPTTTVKFTTQAGDKPITHTIALGKSVDGNPQSRYARIDDGPAIAILSAAASDDLGRSALDLVDRGMLNFPVRDLTAVRRSMNGQQMSLEKKDGAWRITKPLDVPADDPAVNEMAERLSALRAMKVAALAVKDFKQFGLEPPAATITLTLQESGGQARESVLQLGNVVSDGRFARIGNGDTVFVLPNSASDPLTTRLTAEPIKFRDRALAKFADADRIVVTRGQRSVTIAKVNGNWKMTGPMSAEAESFELDDLVLATSRLHADDLVADAPTDLKPFGLDHPEIELKFYLGDQEALKLLVSAKDAEGQVCVKAANSDLVGKLNVGLSNRVSAEFRKRSLWGNFDVAQADTLVINSGSGGPPLLMNKTESGWHFADNSQQTVKPEAVSDILATLAALKAERYVVDQNADLKLFGLDPAARVIVAKTRTGQTTTLHLGRYEGDSKRLYATVPGSDGAVVVLSEGDSTRLMKPAGEFGRK